MNWQEYIVKRHGIMLGKPVIIKTRSSVELQSLAFPRFEHINSAPRLAAPYLATA